MRHLARNVHVCARVRDPRKSYVSVYENAQRIVSRLMLVFKGFHNTHTQLTSLSYRHAKRHVRYGYIRKH